MPKSQKRMVAGLLSFAAMGSTATIVRLPYIQSLSQSFDGREGDFLCKILSLRPLHTSNWPSTPRFDLSRCLALTCGYEC
jgi:hypothetical protein